MVFHEVYIDESGTHEGSRAIALAGYVFTSPQAHRFSRDWGKDLIKYGLPFAHMTDCATGNGVYKSMSLADRIRSEKDLIAHIKRRTLIGFGVAVDPALHAAKFRNRKWVPSPYTLCLLSCVRLLHEWAVYNNIDTKFSYIFEAGHRDQGRANEIMSGIHGEYAKTYVSHSFVDKRYAPPLQAADMLAWQFAHHINRREAGFPELRKDFVALIRPKDMFREYLEDGLAAWAAMDDESTRKTIEMARAKFGDAGAAYAAAKILAGPK